MRPVCCKIVSLCVANESDRGLGTPGSSSRIAINCDDVTDPIPEIVAASELHRQSMIQNELRQLEAVDDTLAVLRKRE